MGGNVPGGAGDDDSDESGSGGWISWFCDLEGHEFFIEVSKSKCLKSNGIMNVQSTK